MAKLISRATKESFDRGLREWRRILVEDTCRTRPCHCRAGILPANLGNRRRKIAALQFFFTARVAMVPARAVC
jgi:hypothetical protein